MTTLDELVLLHVNDDTPFGEFARRYKDDPTATGKCLTILQNILDRGLADQYRRVHANRFRIQFVGLMVYDLESGDEEKNGWSYVAYSFKTWGELTEIVGRMLGIPDLAPEVVSGVFNNDTPDDSLFTNVLKRYETTTR